MGSPAFAGGKTDGEFGVLKTWRHGGGSASVEGADGMRIGAISGFFGRCEKKPRRGCPRYRYFRWHAEGGGRGGGRIGRAPWRGPRLSLAGRASSFRGPLKNEAALSGKNRGPRGANIGMTEIMLEGLVPRFGPRGTGRRKGPA